MPENLADRGRPQKQDFIRYLGEKKKNFVHKHSLSEKNKGLPEAKGGLTNTILLAISRNGSNPKRRPQRTMFVGSGYHSGAVGDSCGVNCI